MFGVQRSPVSRLVWDQEVVGSNPATPTKKPISNDWLFLFALKTFLLYSLHGITCSREKILLEHFKSCTFFKDTYCKLSRYRRSLQKELYRKRFPIVHLPICLIHFLILNHFLNHFVFPLCLLRVTFENSSQCSFIKKNIYF